jgi:hypothetical protein
MRGPSGQAGLVGMVQHVTSVVNAGVHVDISGSATAAAGVFARYRDQNNYTAAYFHDAANVVILFDVRNGQLAILGSGSANINWASGHRVSLLLNGKQAIAAIGGQSVLSAPLNAADHFSAGKAGIFQASTPGLSFDNFSIVHVDSGS